MTDALFRVGFATATSGTIDIAIGAAIRSASIGDYLTPSEAGIADGQRVEYFITDGNNLAVGVGVYSTTGPTLARDTNEKRWTGSGSLNTSKLSLSGSAKVYLTPVTTLATRTETAIATSATSLTPNVDNIDVYRYTALAANITINAPIGTPYDGQPLLFEFRDDNTQRNVSWNVVFAGGVLPGNTADSTVYQRNVLFKWNASRAKWVLERTWDETAAYATISYVGGKTAFSAATGNNPSAAINALTGGSNTSPSLNDVILAYVVLDGTADLTLTMNSSGYTKLGELYSDDTRDTNMALFAKYSDGTETTCIATNQIGQLAVLAVEVWRGCEIGSPLDIALQTATGASDYRANPPSATPVTAGAFISVCGGCISANTTVLSSSELTNFIAVQTSTVPGPAVGVGYVTGTVGVAFDPATFTGSSANDNTNSWAAMTAVLRPRSLN